MMKKVFVLIVMVSVAFLSGCIFDRTTSADTSTTTTSTTVFPTTTTTTMSSSTTATTTAGKPTLSSGSSVNYTEGSDLVLTFELYDGEFVSLSGNGIEAADYQYGGGQVTIDSAFFDSVFTNNPEQDVIVLSYTLSYSGGAVVGYVYIHNAD